MPHQTVNNSPEIPLVASSGNIAATAATATLTPPAGYTAYVSDICLTGLGATAASTQTLTITGPSTTLSYIIRVPAGVTTAVPVVQVDFTTPVPASAPGVPIVVSIPSFGAGNTNVCVNASGYALA
jgi:hypothetical protein